MRNIIDKTEVILQTDNGDYSRLLYNKLKDVPDGLLYSYTVRKGQDKQGDNRYLVSYCVSQTARYNTVNIHCAIANIVNAIYNTHKQRGIIAYEQPTLDILVDVLEPLVHTLVVRQHKRWQRFTYDDLKQECFLVLCTLYRKGYYIHKLLLQRSFDNAVYLRLRKLSRDHIMVSLDAQLGGNVEGLTIADSVIDEQEQYEREQAEQNEILQQEFALQRELVLDIISERQYSDIIRQYRTKTVDGRTASRVHKIKNSMIKKGYNKEYWISHYEE